jgi:ATP-dependent Clp protease ATP-binding subunit ClpX
MDKIKLHFEDDVLVYIVEKAMEFKLGARGLRSICEAVMIDAMYEMPSNEVAEINITVDYAKEKLEKANLGRLKAA